MSPRLKIVAEEILMCGLKSIPYAGRAFEVIDAVQSRHALLAQSERLEEIERQMSRMDRRLRDLVEEEIRVTLQRLGEPALDGPTLTAEIRNLRCIQAQGWEPTLFEGLLRNSSHWDELKSRPQHYGRVLDGQTMIDPEGIHVLIDAEPLRVLELTPFAFAALLANQSQGVPGAEIQAKSDIWAFPTRTIRPSASALAAGRSSPDHQARVRPAAPPKPQPAPRIVTPQKTFTNSIGMTLVRIEPGSFLMGSTKEQIDQLLRLFPASKREWFDVEQPQHPIKITRPFFLGTYPVTQGQYQAIMGSNPSHFKGSDDLPVEQVSWFDAVAFCNKLSEREKRTPFYRIEGSNVTMVGGNGYRLPTEAEWEYACRAGSTRLCIPLVTTRIIWASIPGMPTVQGARLTRWAISDRTPGACMMCWVTSGSGAVIGMMASTTPRPLPPTPRRDQGLVPGHPGRLLGRRRQVLPSGVPQQAHAGIPGQPAELPGRRSSGMSRERSHRAEPGPASKRSRRPTGPKLPIPAASV